MHEFDVTLSGGPPHLVRMAEALAAKNVNIISISTERKGPMMVVRLITDKGPRTEKALRGAGYHFRKKEIACAEMPDKPGEFAKLARHLLDNGVRIRSAFIIGTKGKKTRVALHVNDISKAKRALRKR